MSSIKMSDPQCVQINKEGHSKAALLYFSVRMLLFDSTFPCTPTTFQKLVENVPNINYVFPATKCLEKLDEGTLIGNTLLHLLEKIKLGSIEYFNVLLDQNADVTIKNGKGNTVIHELIEEDLKENFIAVGPDDRNRLLHASSALSTQIHRAVTTNPRNKNGLSHFHVACMVNHVPAVEFFLKHGASVNDVVNEDSPILPGFTALHFAANYFALDVVKVLLKHNVNVNAKDTQGISPTYILIRKKLKIWVALTTSRKNNNAWYLENIETYCKEIDQMIILITKNESANLAESLHALCTMQDISVIEQFLNSKGACQLNRQLPSDMPMWPGYSALHFAAHFSVDMVRLLVKKGAQLELKDAKGVTAFDICLQRFKPREILSILECHPTWLSIKIHLSSWVRRTKISNSNGNVNIHVDSPVCAGYTPLHVTVALTGMPKDYWNIEKDYFTSLQYYKSKDSKKYLERVKLCLKLSPDVTVKNASGSTPLHLAFQLQESHVVYLLLENHTEVVNPVDANNLSHLHIACAAKNEALVKKLLSVESDVNRTIMSKYIWCDGKSEFFTMAKGSTALHFAAIVHCPGVVKLLIENGADVLAKDCDGFDPLETILKHDFLSLEKEGMTKVIELLIREIARVLVEATDGPDQILRRYNVLLQKHALNHILSSDDVIQNRIFESVGITPLHCACQRKDLDRVRQLLKNRSDVNARVSMDSPLWPGNTPLHISIEKLDTIIADVKDELIIRFLLDHGADVTVVSADRETPLHMVSSYYLHRPDLDVTPRLVELLLSHHKDFAVNPVSVDGLSHFHVACFTNNIEAVKKFIERGVDVNQATDFFFFEFGGYSPLHFAAHFFRDEVVKLLLAHGANVHWKAIGENNVLHSAVPIYQALGRNTIESLIRAGADVNAKNAWGETPLEKLLKVTKVHREEVDLYLKQNCRVNYYNPIKEESLLAAALDRDSEGTDVFDAIIKAADTTVINKDGRNAIHNVVSLKPPDFDLYERIDDINTLIPESNYSFAIDILVGLGLDIDHQEHKGATPLHVAAQMENVNGIIGLLNNGADINFVDNEYKTAYAYTLQLALREADEGRWVQEDFDLWAVKVFAMHVAKLNFLNLKVSESNKDIDAQARTLFDLRPNRMLEEFRVEVEKSKSQIIGPVTLYDFMSETGAISTYPNMLEFNRETIDAFFKDNVEFLQGKFPLFAGLVILQHRKAVARVKLIEPAMDSINFLVQFNIPYLCTNMILKFLSNEDLKNVIAVME